MRRVTLRSLWEHKRRLASTVVAILLGVAFMSGTLVFADTLDRVFDDLFAQANEEVDAQVQGEVLFESDFAGSQRARIDEALVDDVRRIDGVAVAEPFVITIGFGSANRVLDAEGDPVGSSQGPPTLLESWVEDDLLNPYTLTDGSRAPEQDDEIALNVAAVEDGDFAVGDRITVSSQFGLSEYTLVGTFTFGNADSSAGAVSADFTLAEAQRLAGAEGKVDNIVARGGDGISPDELVERIAPVLPDDAEVVTGEVAAEQLADSVTEGFGFLRQLLLVFAAIALIVGTFIISNTFAILVAQRTRELALLRAVGASRGQVFGSVLLEATVVGFVAALLGLAAGIGLAAGVTALLKAAGVDFPSTSLVVGSSTILTALIVGLVVTVVAAVFPAIRATRVPPLAALRDVAIDRSGASRFRAVAGFVLLALSVVLLAQAWGADGDVDVIPTVGLGALAALVGAIVIGPVLASPTVRVLGVFLARFKGVTGRLALENAARSPKRTSATASALLIGVALIGFITVFAASAKESVSAEVNRGISGDLVVQSSSGGFGPPSGFPADVADRITDRPDVEAVSPIAFTEAQVTYPDGHTAVSFLTAIDPTTLPGVLEPRMEEGRATDLAPGGVLVDRLIADDNDLSIGDPITITVPGGGTVDAVVQGISDDQVLLGNWAITRSDYAAAVFEMVDLQVFVDLRSGIDIATAQEEIEDLIADVPSMEVLDRDQFIGDIANQITGVLNFIYGLLALSIIIAMIGIANTLSLSVHERTRELGLLRAVGMARPQLRSTIRWEAVLISILGTLVGLGLGLVLSRALIEALSGSGFSRFAIPVNQLVVLVLIAAALGVLASLRPAARAAKLNVLQAIATE